MSKALESQLAFLPCIGNDVRQFVGGFMGFAAAMKISTQTCYPRYATHAATYVQG